MRTLTATICLAVALLFGCAGVSWSKNSGTEFRECSKISGDDSIGEFTQECIQLVLENVIRGQTGSKRLVFIFKIGGEFDRQSQAYDDIYAQGTMALNGLFKIEIISYHHTPTLDKNKIRKLVNMGWNLPDPYLGTSGNFWIDIPVSELFNGNASKLLFESLKVYGVPTDKLNVRYTIFE